MSSGCLTRLCCGHVGLLRALSLGAGVLGMAMAGSSFAFSAYANAVKETFNLTQTQLELLGSLNNFGVGLGFPAGLIQERFGSVATLVIGTLIVGPASVALWSSTRMPSFYSHNFYLLCIYFLLTGFGAIFSYIPSLTDNVVNFRSAHRGKIVAILDSAFSGGPMIFAFVYGMAFVQGHVLDQANQNLGGYFIMIAVAFAAINAFGCVFIRKYPLEEAEGLLGDTEEETEVEKEEEKEGVVEENDLVGSGGQINRRLDHYDNRDLTGLGLIRSPCFHLIFWPYIFTSGLQFMVQNNLAVYLKSFNLVQYTTTLTTLSFAVGMVAKLAGGFLSDVTRLRFPRIGYLAIANGLQSLALLGSLFWADNLVYLFFMAICVSIANGFLWCLTPTMVSEQFGTKYLARNWGAMLLGNSISGWICQLMFGALYSHEIDRSSSRDCLGLKCFLWSFSVSFVLSTAAVALNIILFVKMRKRMADG